MYKNSQQNQLTLYQSFLLNIVTSEAFLERSPEEMGMVLDYLERNYLKSSFDDIEDFLNNPLQGLLRDSKYS